MGVLSDDFGVLSMDDGEPPYDIYDVDENIDVWVDGEALDWEWQDIETPHLQAIVRGLENGKAYWGQEWKLKRAKQELAQRLSKTVGDNERSQNALTKKDSL